MGAFELGPFDNDSALDFVDEFLRVESPARCIRAAISRLDKDCYHDIDEVQEAWAACELVAIASSGGDGYDLDDPQYEAASRLRPNKTLINQCLATLGRVLDENSELSELVDAKQRRSIESHLASTRARLEQGANLDKLPRLKVPKTKAMQVYAIAASSKWLIGLYDFTKLIVLDTVFEHRPQGLESIQFDDVSVLFNCSYLGAVGNFVDLGRIRPAAGLIEAYEYVSTIRWSCLSSSDGADFETCYWLNRGQQFTRQHYDDIRSYPFSPDYFPDQFADVVSEYVANGTLSLPPVPTPAELRDDFLARCQNEWSSYLEGDGGGPFSFPRLYEQDVSHYVVPWIKLHLRTDWRNGGMCLPDDLHHYFLAGLVAASLGVYAASEVPDRLMPILSLLRAHIDSNEINGAIHVVSRVLDKNTVIPRVLADDPSRREDFFSQATAIRDALRAMPHV